MAPVKKEPIHWRYSDRRYPHPKKKMDYVDTYFDILTKDGLSDWWSQTKQKIGNKHSYYVTYDKGDRGSFEYEKNKNYQGLYEDGDFWYQTVAELVILDLSIGDEYRKNNQVLINSIKAKMMLPIRKALIQDPENTMQKIASLARDFNAIALYIDYCKYLINPNQYSGRQVMNSIDIAERLSSDISYRFDADGKFLLELYNFTDLKPAPYFFYFENISPSIVKSILFKLKAAERILSKTSAT